MTKHKHSPQSGRGLQSFAKGEDAQTNCTPSHSLIHGQITNGKKMYNRDRDLPGLLHLFPSEIERLSRADPKAFLQRLILALHAERRRGRSGHWRYSLARHIGLMQAVAAEKNRH